MFVECTSKLDQTVNTLLRICISVMTILCYGLYLEILTSNSPMPSMQNSAPADHLKLLSLSRYLVFSPESLESATLPVLAISRMPADMQVKLDGLNVLMKLASLPQEARTLMLLGKVIHQ